MKLLPDSIKWRIWIYYSVVVAIAIAVMAGVMAKTQRKSFRKGSEEEYRDYASTLAPYFFDTSEKKYEGSGYIKPPGSKKLPHDSRFHSFVNKIEKEDGFVLALSSNNEVVFQSTLAPAPSELPELNPKRKQFDKGATKKFFYIILKTPKKESLLIGAPRSLLKDRYSLVLWKWTRLGALIWLIVSLLGFWIISHGLKPIQKINQKAKRIAEGDLSERISITSQRSELGQLATTLNTTFSKLEEVLKMQVQFTSDSSHELRTPIAAILAECQFALKKMRPSERNLETIEVCHESAQHMKTLVERLSLLAEFDADETVLELEEVNLAKIARQAGDLIEPLALEHEITFKTDLADVMIVADRHRINQAIMNLLRNAVKYTDKGGRVRLTTGQYQDGGFIEVSDTGIGIPEASLPYLFDRFYRVDQARNMETGGSGLGLAISKTIVESHQGEISVSSKEGIGSTFRIELPS